MDKLQLNIISSRIMAIFMDSYSFFSASAGLVRAA